MYTRAGSRNDESGFLVDGRSNNAADASPGNRLTVHSIRDAQGRVLGLAPRRGAVGSRENSNEEQEQAGGWEPVVEAWTAHEGAVTGIDVVGGFGDLLGVSGVVTSGGDG